MTGDDDVWYEVSIMKQRMMGIGSYALAEAKQVVGKGESLLLEAEDRSRPWALAQEGCPLRWWWCRWFQNDSKAENKRKAERRRVIWWSKEAGLMMGCVFVKRDGKKMEDEVGQESAGGQHLPSSNAIDACSLTECWCWKGKQLNISQLPFFPIILVLAEYLLITYQEIIHLF
jgi:hypothetical protein